MKKKLVKWLGIIIGISIPIAPILILIDYNSNERAIFATGSSSILPLMQKYSEIYTDSEIVPTGGGSGKGLNDAVYGNTDLGDMSSNKKDDILKNKTYLNGWNKLQNRTITIAQDAEAIALNIPKDLKYKSMTNKKNGLKFPVVRPWAIADIYSKNSGTTRWSDLLEGVSGNSANKIVAAYGRNGGKSASGTSDGFFHILEKFASYAKPTINLDESHSSSNIKKTPESNAQAYSVLNEYNNYGITYLSLGYLEQILKQPDQSNNYIKIGDVDINSGNTKNYSSTPSLDNYQPDKWWLPTLDNARKNHYGWIRPYNVVFSTIFANKHQYIYDFLKFILSGGGQKYVTQLQFVALPKGNPNGSDLGFQFQANNITTSDKQLNDSTSKTSKNDKHYAYGWQG